MATFNVLGAFLTFMAISSVFAAPTCDVTLENYQEKLTQYAMECVAHNPELMWDVMEKMNNPKALTGPAFMCNHPADVVKAAVCMKDKLKGCVPGKEVRTFLDLLISTKRLTTFMSFMCKHKTELMAADKCFDETARQEFGACFGGKVESIATSIISGNGGLDMKNAVCQVIGLEESCLKKYHGQCDDSFVKLFIEMLEKFFPMSGCPKSDLKDQTKSSPFDAILVRGQPLKYVPYRVINGGGH